MVKVASLSLLASMLPVFPISAAPHKDYSVKVGEVLSGDKMSVIIDGESKIVRVIGVDAPDRIGPKTKAQCYNREAWMRAKKLVENSYVTLEEDPAMGEDKDGNLWRHVYLPDGRFFAQLMLRDGYARVVKQKKAYNYMSKFVNWEKEGKTKKRGLWAVNKCDGLLIKKK